MWQHFTLMGTGLYLPRRVLTAEDMDRRFGLIAGWTRQQTRVLVRHECEPPETLASMAREAIALAMHEADVGWSDIDLILDGSTCRHQFIPCNAAYLQHELGQAAQGIPCMDIQSTCLGFVLALHVANALLSSGPYRHILIVCAEAPLVGVNPAEPESACLMGDGAAAAVVRRAEPTPNYFFEHETFGQHLQACQVRGGGHNLLPSAYSPETEAAFHFHMDGPRLFHAACTHLPRMTESLVEQSGSERGQLWVIPHQASPRALAGMRRLLRFRSEQWMDRVAHMGNLVAASIPAVLHQCRTEGRVRAGDRVLLLGTSAGYSQAGLIFRA